MAVPVSETVFVIQNRVDTRIIQPSAARLRLSTKSRRSCEQSRLLPLRLCEAWLGLLGPPRLQGLELPRGDPFPERAQKQMPETEIPSKVRPSRPGFGTKSAFSLLLVSFFGEVAWLLGRFGYDSCAWPALLRPVGVLRQQDLTQAWVALCIREQR